MPPAGADPFDLLGLPARFDLSRDQVEARYLALVRALHPDVAAPDSGAVAGAAALNDARAVLLDPERRAGALLARLGGPAPEQDRSLPPAFLAEMMEVREGVEGARASRDESEVERWRGWARERRAAIIREVSGLFDGLTAPAAAGALASVRRTLNAWRYVERMIEQLEE